MRREDTEEQERQMFSRERGVYSRGQLLFLTGLP